jgi:hypothetical protein
MKVLLNFSLLFLVFSANAQQAQDKIFWEGNKLTWDDFRAKPDRSSSFQANTSAGLSYSWGVRNENGVVTLNYEVFSYFNPNSSWVYPESRNNAHLLSHEQLHFDITELHARKLRKKLSEVKIDQLGKDPRAALNKLYENIEKGRAAMQMKYDKETSHSINKEAEARWQEFIGEEMKKHGDSNS